MFPANSLHAKFCRKQPNTFASRGSLPRHSQPPPPAFVLLLLMCSLDAFGQGSHSSSGSYASSVEEDPPGPDELPAPADVAAAWATFIPSFPGGGEAVDAATWWWRSVVILMR